jgi:dihydroflavonol-4-reductase
MAMLVTGATGLIGNNVVRLLLDRGQAVRVLVRETADLRPLADLDVETVHGDVRHAGSVRRACEGVRCVIHCAGYVHIGWSGSEMHHAVNVVGTANVADAALSADARMIHVSTVDTLGIRTREHPADEETPREGHVLCPYVVTKRAGEDALLERVANGLDAVIVNPNYVIGPWDWKPSSGRMLLEIARGRALLAPPGGNDFCDARDIASGILAAAERGQTGRRYILSGEPLSYVEAWRLFAQVSGARAPLGVATRGMVRLAGRVGDVWGRITRREPDVNSAATALSTLPHHFSNRRAAAELDYRPRPVRYAVEAAWKWFVETGYA